MRSIFLILDMEPYLSFRLSRLFQHLLQDLRDDLNLVVVQLDRIG